MGKGGPCHSQGYSSSSPVIHTAFDDVDVYEGTPVEFICHISGTPLKICHFLGYHILQGPREEMSGVPIQLSGDTLYMSTTLIKAMVFFHDILLVCIEGDIKSHRLSISLQGVGAGRERRGTI